ncbi:MAG: DNA-binding protein [Pseudoflavonifractor sp.]
MKPVTLGLDTSNYTTSVAVFDGSEGENIGHLLEVPAGSLGLRQSEALFQHVRRLPACFDELRAMGLLAHVTAVGASTRPRSVEGSYMPCFLAGEGTARALADTLNAPYFPCSHQEGHLAAAAWSAGRMDLLDRDCLVWHLSGGTTELLLVRPDGVSVSATCIGGSQDISAGQLIDRTGKGLQLAFPAGKALDALAQSSDYQRFFPVKQKDLTFSLSGVENQVNALLEQGLAPADIARFALLTIANAVAETTAAALKLHPGLPVLCSGGVASNSILRGVLRDAIFAAPRYSTDNALGVAILARRRLENGEGTA